MPQASAARCKQSCCTLKVIKRHINPLHRLPVTMLAAILAFLVMKLALAAGLLVNMLVVVVMVLRQVAVVPANMLVVVVVVLRQVALVLVNRLVVVVMVLRQGPAGSRQGKLSSIKVF